MSLSFAPDIISKLNKLERVLISRRTLFKKNSIIQKGIFPKLKLIICNIPINVVDITYVFSRGAHSNGLIVVKLKHKLRYKIRVYFKTVLPEPLYNQCQEH